MPSKPTALEPPTIVLESKPTVEAIVKHWAALDDNAYPHLLDTNILSNIIKPVPSEALFAWMANQADTDLFISSLTVAEIRRGILEKPAGRKRDQLEAWFIGPEGPQALFTDRVLAFDDKAGLIWARLMADGKIKGRPRSALDTIIAAVAEANGCVVVTDNEQDFEGIELINPVRAAK